MTLNKLQCLAAEQKRTPIRKVDGSARKFIAWDGEGINIAGIGKPQSYVLFGSSEGCISARYGLSTFECLDHIIETGKRNPRSFHVGFAFSYDANMIVHSLSPSRLSILHKNGWVKVRNNQGEVYTITFAKGKFFRVTKDKTTVQIFDIFSFYACSFVDAYEQTVGTISDIVKSGKAKRKEFTLEDFDEIQEYWNVEIQQLKQLAEELRKRVYNAGYRIVQWYGPGALASYAMRQHGVKQHMEVPPDGVRLASRYAYAGGRFELYKVGRTIGPIYGIDINSAYPHAISKLPSLKGGEWVYVQNPNTIKQFGIYHCRLQRYGGFVRLPSPLFHRDRDHNISYPWNTDGWYFSPEAHIAKKFGATISEGWEFHEDTDTLPFHWIGETYATRQDWKKRGISAQLALKLCMNSVYGKLAQRVGWSEFNQRIPPFHQLEWAGWVTSFTRSRLFNVMMQIPFKNLIAVETDGIYTTTNPQKLGIINSNGLGEWEVTEFQEILYVQSGLAWLRDENGNWKDKRRGLDKGTFSLDACQDYLRKLHPRPTGKLPWQPYEGTSTRFVTLGKALASKWGMSKRHCVWETEKRELIPGYGGKRVHIHKACDACEQNLTAYDKAHDLVIGSMATLSPHSYPHSVPWEQEEGHARWRDYEELGNEDVTLQYV